MSVGDISERKDRPAYVRFERRAVEDRTKKSVDGRWPKRDVDYAKVTPPYSRDVFEQVASDWLAQMAVEVQNNRLPQNWYEGYVQAYERWKTGQEIPLNGEPIKGWGVISPAQQANLIAINILTVEDLAAVNDEGCRRIGMGAAELRDKAKAWLSQMADKGPLTQENAMLKGENIALKGENESLKARVKELSERLELVQRGEMAVNAYAPPQPRQDGIAADDILDTPEPARRGRPRKAAEVTGEL